MGLFGSLITIAVVASAYKSFKSKRSINASLEKYSNGINIDDFHGRGSSQELEILLNLHERFKSPDYHIFHHLYVPRGNGIYAELDAMVLGRKGIVVIESKAYHGVIKGNRDDINWSQYIGGALYKLYNPVKQNNGHIQSLISYIGCAATDCYSVIVFPSDTAVEVDCGFGEFIITDVENVSRSIAWLLEAKQEVFTEERVINIAALCTMCTNASVDVKDSHRRRVRRINEFGAHRWPSSFK